MNKGGEYKVDSLSMGQRALKNTALGMLMSLGDQETFDLCERQYNSATNMTDESAALTFKADSDHPKRQESLQKFYNKWKHEPLVMQKWLELLFVPVLQEKILWKLCASWRRTLFLIKQFQTSFVPLLRPLLAMRFTFMLKMVLGTLL